MYINISKREKFSKHRESANFKAISTRKRTLVTHADRQTLLSSSVAGRGKEQAKGWSQD
jgi:hypothetical protein